MASCQKLNTNISIESLLAEINILKHKNQILQTLNTNTTKRYKEIVSLNENLELQFRLKEKSFNIKLHEVRKENIGIAISQNHLKKTNECLSEEINLHKHQNQLFHDRLIKKDEEIKKLQQEINDIESELNEMYAKMNEYDHLINNQEVALYDMEQSLKIRTGCNHSMRRINKWNKYISNKWNKTIRIPSSSSPILRSGTSNSLSADLYIYDKKITRWSSLIVSEPTGNDGSNEDMSSPQLCRGTPFKTNAISSSSNSISSAQIVQSVTSISLDIEHED